MVPMGRRSFSEICATKATQLNRTRVRVAIIGCASVMEMVSGLGFRVILIVGVFESYWPPWKSTW